jgi:hypothetical protein
MDSLRYHKHLAFLLAQVLAACFFVGCSAMKASDTYGELEMASTAPLAMVAAAPSPVAAVEAMPVPQAPVARAPMVAPVGNFAQWNFWVSDRSEIAPAPRSGVAIALGRLRNMHFRMTTIDFSSAWKGVRRVGLSTHIGSLIEQKRASGESAPLEFVALVNAADPSAIKIGPSQRQRPFSVDLEKLKASPPPPTSLSENTEASKGLEKANLGEFGFEFTALKSGKHRVSIVLVEKATGVPVQVMAVEVQADAGIEEQLANAGGNVGIDTALAPGAEFSLVLHELGSDSGPTLIAILVAHDRATGANRLFSWNTGFGLNELQELIAPYRDNLSNSPSLEALNEASWQFGRLLFSPRIDPQVEALTQENRDLATTAAGLLFDAARDAAGMATPSTLLVRLVPDDADGEGSFSSPTLPLGAIALGPDAASALNLGERMIVALLLPDQSLNAALACPSSWYIAQPPKELDPADPVSIAVDNSGSYWTLMQAGLQRQSNTLSELRSHLGQGDGKEAAEVVSYLGHNGANGLFLDTNAATPLAPYAIQRVFAPSSVAILNACETATDAIKPGTLIGRLFKLKVGSVIATVTPVEGALAGAFMRCQAAVLEKKAELTVGELQLRTTQCLFSKERGEQWGGNGHYFHHYALNYFLVGNPYQKICVPKGTL